VVPGRAASNHQRKGNKWARVKWELELDENQRMLGVMAMAFAKVKRKISEFKTSG
jgi:hypothetical protein